MAFCVACGQRNEVEVTACVRCGAALQRSAPGAPSEVARAADDASGPGSAQAVFLPPPPQVPLLPIPPPPPADATEGWKTDPTGRFPDRYWNGSWTQWVRDRSGGSSWEDMPWTELNRPQSHSAGASGSPEVANYVAWSIVSLFMCLPLGVVALVKSNNANAKVISGDLDGARADAAQAKALLIAAAMLFGVGLLVMLAG